ncbi:retrovirus-related Pol polyprotein from transposon 297 [Trichonephila clavipes]|uniref:Retrovirus-related Pol polyprotein from transposon 297 n=1 Tax=Trichonephila clavipes TaxID=2585209 RepID=A0A8X7B8P7_TRICX|nr:retrovirus-related Pol polyprotein from transposon 297 [Trichonephila clavipes]
MTILLSDDIPVSQRSRRLPFVEQKIVVNQIQEWLNANIIKPSCSEYAASIVLFRKKNGEHRLCVDYRNLNRQMIKDKFPLPLTEVLDKLENSKVYTSLDLKNRFFHVPMDPNSTKYTSLVTHEGQYEFLRVPFGLSNSPSVFQRFIYTIFRKLIRDNILIVYMDDLLIPSQNEAKGLNKLRLVLQTAADFALELNLKKYKGSAFTSTKFQNFCQDEPIEHIQITTGVPRGKGQIERMHETIIPVLTKLTIEEFEKWFKHAHRLQRIMNSSTTRSIKFTSKMKSRDENKKQYNKHRKPAYNYKPGDTVAIERTLFGTGLKLQPKYFGPYEVTKVNKHDRYEVQKLDNMKVQIQTLQRGFGWDVFGHPSYSPDLTPSDFPLFLHLKSFLAGKHFNNDKELKENVSNWLKTQAATFYEEGIEKLVPRYDTCLQNFGSYVEREPVDVLAYVTHQEDCRLN